MDTLKKIFISLCILLWSQNFLSAQTLRTLGMNPIWRDGHIVLKDNSSYRGKVYYNTNFGTIQYKPDNESEIITFQENRILSLNYFEEETNRSRNYHAFTYIDTLADREYESLFEIIKDFKTFAVLSRSSKASMFLPANYNSYNVVGMFKDFGVTQDKMFIQVEGIFFIDSRNKLELYMLIRNTDFDGVLNDYSKTKSKIIERSILKEYTKKFWNNIEQYIKQNKLKPQNKNDLLQILDYYEELSKNEN